MIDDQLRMTNFEQFLKDLGGLHDARVTKLTLDAVERLFVIEVDDVYSNFEGLSGYKGLTPARIVLKEISQVRVALNVGTEEFNIYTLSVDQINENQWAASITFWSEGKITMNFDGVEFPQNP